MRITFRATGAGFEADEYALVCGVTGVDAGGSERSLIFQREAEGCDDAWGVHLVLDDQSQGDYDRVAGCRLERRSLTVDLAGPLGSLADVTGFDIELAVDDATFGLLAAGLPRIFRGTAGVFEATAH